MYKRTEKYIRQNISVTQQEAIKRILTDKGYQNRERLADLQSSIKLAITQAKLYVGENEQEINSEDPQARINKAFQALILRAYPNLVMLRGINYTEKDVSQCLKRSKDGLFSNDASSLADSEQEILAFILSNKRGGIRTTIKSVIERFEAKPYGWYFAAIACNIAHLIGRGKIELKDDSNTLEDKALEKALLNTSMHPNIVIEPEIIVPASQVRNLKEIYEEFFDAPPRSGEAKELAFEISQSFKDKLVELEKIVAQKSQFPFLATLNEVILTLRDIATKPYTWYFSELESYEDKLVNYKTKVIAPIISFMNNGALKTIYQDATSFIDKQKPNFAYIDDNEVKSITDILVDIECYKDNKLNTVKTLMHSLNEKITEALQKKRDEASVAIESMKNRLESTEEFTKLTEDQQASYLQKFDNFLNGISSQTLIAVISDNLRRFEDREYQNMLIEIASPVIPKLTQTPTGENSRTTQPVPEPKVEYVNSKTLRLNFNKPWLSDEEDVDSYLKKMREVLMNEIRDGKRIQV